MQALVLAAILLLGPLLFVLAAIGLVTVRVIQTVRKSRRSSWSLVPMLCVLLMAPAIAAAGQNRQETEVDLDLRAGGCQRVPRAARRRAVLGGRRRRAWAKWQSTADGTRRRRRALRIRDRANRPPRRLCRSPGPLARGPDRGAAGNAQGVCQCRGRVARVDRVLGRGRPGRPDEDRRRARAHMRGIRRLLETEFKPDEVGK